jgi:hypothetical protein
MLMIRRTVPLVLLCVLVGAACGTTAEEHWIQDGRSAGRIVPAVDDAPTRHAAEELQRYLAEATGTTVPISMVGGPGPEILVGWGDNAIAAAPNLGPGAFVWKSEGDRLIIGGPGKGTLYGVYAFLEEHVGIRRYTPEVTHIPEVASFDLPRLDDHRGRGRTPKLGRPMGRLVAKPPRENTQGQGQAAQGDD